MQAEKDRKRAAEYRAEDAAVKHRAVKTLRLPGPPLDFAKLPNGRFAVLGIGVISPGRFNTTNSVWIKFFQADGKSIGTYENIAPKGYWINGGVKGLHVYPGGKYIFSGGINYRKFGASTPKLSGSCLGPLIFSAEGVLLPRESYPPEIKAPFETNRFGGCSGRLRYAAASDGTAISIFEGPKNNGNIYLHNSQGKIVQSRKVENTRMQYDHGRFYALSDYRFITLGHRSDFQLHQGIQNKITSGSIPGKHGGLYRGFAALPSGGWSFLLNGSTGAWATGVKIFDANGKPLFHAKPSCGIRPRGVWPTGLWAEGNSIYALYKLYLSGKKKRHCVQEFNAAGKATGRAHTIDMMYKGDSTGEDVIGFGIDPRNGDRMFVVAVPYRQTGYLMRTDSKLVQKKW